MKLTSMRQYLKPLKSAHFRSAIFAEAKKRMTGTAINQANREALQDAIFVVENEAEHARGPGYPPVVAMRTIRNRILDDLGWNEQKEVTCYG